MGCRGGGKEKVIHSFTKSHPLSTRIRREAWEEVGQWKGKNGRFGFFFNKVI